MVTRRRRTMAERARVLRAWKASGLSAERYSAENAVSVDSLYRWRREAQARAMPRRRTSARATRDRRPEPASALLPVHVFGDGAPRAASAVEVILRDGRRVRCAADVPVPHVAALVAALEMGDPRC